MDNMDKPTVENKLKSAWIVQIAVTGTHQTSMSLCCSYDKADFKKRHKKQLKKRVGEFHRTFVAMIVVGKKKERAQRPSLNMLHTCDPLAQNPKSTSL